MSTDNHGDGEDDCVLHKVRRKIAHKRTNRLNPVQFLVHQDPGGVFFDNLKTLNGNNLCEKIHIGS